MLQSGLFPSHKIILWICSKYVIYPEKLLLPLGHSKKGTRTENPNTLATGEIPNC
jgi:hypothetical protein